MKGILMATVDQSAVLAMAPPRYELVAAHHLTLRFRVSAQPYQAWLGQTFTARVTGEAWNDDIQALRVALPEAIAALCENAHPHVTVSHRPGVTPKRSNAMLEAPAHVRPLDAELAFEVTWQPF
jgi:hypothetical protein